MADGGTRPRSAGDVSRLRSYVGLTTRSLRVIEYQRTRRGNGPNSLRSTRDRRGGSSMDGRRSLSIFRLARGARDYSGFSPHAARPRAPRPPYASRRRQIARFPRSGSGYFTIFRGDCPTSAAYRRAKSTPRRKTVSNDSPERRIATSAQRPALFIILA
ncbi:hypothetical protein EVAR_27846_1 [Eumeta japonica]|uniref:Uncharacterized protein n=1 Tax=Eumeta variegata TaxID=151549 RepID=A0A4C1VJ96_EUMVA|nr:hypothetical protein EVAR_27846_1 [Eumeta japonica]